MKETLHKKPRFTCISATSIDSDKIPSWLAKMKVFDITVPLLRTETAGAADSLSFLPCPE